MVKKDIVNAIHEKTGISKKVIKTIVECNHEVIMDAVTKGDKVTLLNFGVFEPVERARKKGTNPQTGEPLWIEARKVPVFSPSQQFRDNVKISFENGLA